MKAEQGAHVMVSITANKHETRASINSSDPEQAVAYGGLAMYKQSTHRMALSPCTSPVRGMYVVPISQVKTESQGCDVTCP